LGAGLVPARRSAYLDASALTIKNGRSAKVKFLTDPERLAELDLAVLEGG
jgi:hypothetical protein